MRLVVTDFLTVDGVMEAPGFEEHRDGRNAWALRVGDEELQGFNQEHAAERRRAALRPDDLPDLGGVLAAPAPTPAALGSTDHRRSEVRRLEDAVRPELGEHHPPSRRPGRGGRAAQGGARRVTCSSTAAPTSSTGSSSYDLVDEFRLLLFPVILGSGKHLFRDGIETHHLRLLSTRSFPSGAVLLTYDREASPGERRPGSRVSAGPRSRCSRSGRQRTSTASSRPSCSPTSSIRRRGRRPSGIAPGGGCSTATTRWPDRGRPLAWTGW